MKITGTPKAARTATTCRRLEDRRCQARSISNHAPSHTVALSIELTHHGQSWAKSANAETLSACMSQDLAARRRAARIIDSISFSSSAVTAASGSAKYAAALPCTLLMRVIARRTLRVFYERHTASKASLDAWFHEASEAKLAGPQDIKHRFPSADILPGNRVVFNIRGNRYPVIVKIHYNTAVVFIRFVGTHAEYDAVDAKTI